MNDLTPEQEQVLETARVAAKVAPERAPDDLCPHLYAELRSLIKRIAIAFPEGRDAS